MTMTGTTYSHGQNSRVRSEAEGQRPEKEEGWGLDRIDKAANQRAEGLSWSQIVVDDMQSYLLADTSITVCPRWGIGAITGLQISGTTKQ